MSNWPWYAYPLVYAAWGVAVFVGSSISAHDTSRWDDDERRTWARVALFSPVWPALILAAIYLGVRYFVDVVRDLRDIAR